MFYRQLAVQLGAGIPLGEAIAGLKEGCEDRGILKMIGAVLLDMDRGRDVAASLGEHPRIFNEILLSMLAAGERGEVVAAALDVLADELEKGDKLKHKILSVVMLPALTLSVAFTVIMILLLYCIPVFSSVLEGMGSHLPAPTLLLVEVGGFITDNILIILLFVSLLPLLLRGRRKLRYGILSKLPAVGSLTRKMCMLMLTRQMSAMLGIKVPVDKALHYAAVNNPLYESQILALAAEASRVDRLPDAVENDPVFPGMFRQMIRVGVRTDTLGACLCRLSTYYEKEFDRGLARFTVIADFTLLLLVGAFVGGLVLSMYLPIFQMAANVV